MTYDVDYFLAKFEATREGEWCEGEVENERGQHCAGGFCSLPKVAPRSSETFKRMYPEAMALINLFEDHGLLIVMVNDNQEPHFQEPTPRERVLSALRWIKWRQAKDLKTKTN